MHLPWNTRLADDLIPHPFLVPPEAAAEAEADNVPEAGAGAKAEAEAETGVKDSAEDFSVAGIVHHNLFVYSMEYER